MAPTTPSTIKHYVRQRERTQQRHAKVCARFTELYQVQRIRYDDCILKLEEEFALAPATIKKILKS